MIDHYNVGWKTYLAQRETDEKRRKRERANAEKQAGALLAQADKMRAKATKAKAAQDMMRRAHRLLSGTEEERQGDKVAKLRFPDPQPCGRTPLMAEGLSKSYGSLEVFTDVDVAIDRGHRVVILGLNGAGKTTLLRLLGGVEQPDTGAIRPGHGLKVGYYAQEHETLDGDRTLLENMRSAGRRPSPTPSCARSSARSCSPATTSTSPPECSPAARRPGWRWPRWCSPAPTSCCSTSPRTTSIRPAGSRFSPLCGPIQEQSSWSPTMKVPLTALPPDRVILLPDGVEDAWSDEFSDLVALA